jgi:hypothetical protein
MDDDRAVLSSVEGNRGESLTLLLPDELLELILHLVVRSGVCNLGRHTVWIIYIVCKRWHDIVSKATRLWAIITVDTLTPLSLLQQFLQRSREAPLDLYLVGALDSHIEMVSHHAKRWRILRYGGDLAALVVTKPGKLPLHNLNHLDLWDAVDIQSAISSLSGPFPSSITRLRIGSALLSDYLFSIPSSIQFLELKWRVHADSELEQLFQRIPNIKELEIVRLMSEPRAINEVATFEPLKMLRKFVIRDPSWLSWMSVINTSTAPALKMFEIYAKQLIAAMPPMTASSFPLVTTFTVQWHALKVPAKDELLSRACEWLLYFPQLQVLEILCPSAPSHPRDGMGLTRWDVNGVLGCIENIRVCPKLRLLRLEGVFSYVSKLREIFGEKGSRSGCEVHLADCFMTEQRSPQMFALVGPNVYVRVNGQLVPPLPAPSVLI